MRQIIRSVLVLLLVCCALSVAVSAAEQSYILAEPGLTVDLPDDMTVFTRDMDEADPNLAAYGFTKADMDALLVDEDIYLDAWDETNDSEIVITMVESGFADYNLYSDTTLETLVLSMKEEYARVGVQVQHTELYQHEQAKFCKIYFSRSEDTGTSYGLQYHTVYDHKAINITMHSYNEILNTEKRQILQSCVDSIVFHTDPQKTETPEPTKSFSYTDPASGVTFTVPDNWVQKELDEDREILSAGFTYNYDEALCIMFGYEDVWAQIPDSEKVGLTRQDMDNSLLSREMIAEMLGCREEDVRSVFFARKGYYCVEIERTETMYGIPLTMHMTTLIHCENGNFYTFQFGGKADHERYGDFEQLMNSVVYPGGSEVIPAGDDASEPAIRETVPEEKAEMEAAAEVGSTMGNILLSLLLTITVYTVPIVIYRYAILKTPVAAKKAKKITIIYGIAAFFVMSAVIYFVFHNGTAGAAVLLWSGVNYRILTGGKKTEQVPEVERLPRGPVKVDRTEIVFCHKCGARLVEGSLFCHGCGTRIPDGGMN